MSTLDFLKMMARMWKAGICLIAASLVVGVAVYAFAPRTTVYRAEGQLVCNYQADVTFNLAKSASKAVQAQYAGCDISVQYDTKADSVKVIVTGADAQRCEDALRDTLDASVESAESFYEGFADPYRIRVMHASKAQAKVNGPGVRVIGVFALGGLAVFALVVIAAGERKQPVVRAATIAFDDEVPVLEAASQDAAERLLSRLTGGGFGLEESASGDGNNDGASSAAVVFAVSGSGEGDHGVASSACAYVQGALGLASAPSALAAPDEAPRPAGKTIAVVHVPDLSDEHRVVQEAQSADAVIVAAERWRDRAPVVRALASDLKAAGARLCAIVLLEEQSAKDA